jgi:hypothetical protein
MKASSTIALCLVSSVSIFGIATSHSPDAGVPSVEPVWVNGVMGVWDPDNGQFVPATSPVFNQTCERIQRRREENNGYYSVWNTTHSWHYSPSTGTYSYGSYGSGGGGGFFGHSSGSSSGGSSSGSSSSFGSIRGGIGGSAHGSGHGGGE